MMVISTYYSSTHFHKDSLFSFQSAIVSEIQCNVNHMAAILKFNMAAL